MKSDGAEFSKAEPKISPCERRFSILIQTGGNSEAVPKGEIEEFNGIVGCFSA
jgi:sulfur transfer protein SufE